MILDIDILKNFRPTHTHLVYPFKNIDECLSYFIRQGYHDIVYVRCELIYGNDIINVDIKTKIRNFTFCIILDGCNGIYQINYNMGKLDSDLYNRYNKLLRIYKVNLLTDIDLDI